MPPIHRRLSAVPLACAALVFSLAACGGSGSSSPAGADAFVPEPGDGNPIAADAAVDADPRPAVFELYTETPAGLVAVGEDGVIPWVFGQQGGSMIQPAFRFPAGELTPGRVYGIQLRHLPDPEAPAAFNVADGFEVQVQSAEAHAGEDGGLYLGSLLDQIGWEGLEGGRLVLEVTVPGATGTLRRALTLRSEGSFENDPCKPFAPELGNSGGCIYADIPIAGTVTAVAPGETPLSCGAEAVIQALIAAASPEARACLQSAQISPPETHAIDGHGATLECLSSVGLATGAALTGVWHVEIAGTCTPDMGITLDADVSACACP